MSRANEIYHFETDIRREIEKITQSSDPNKETLLRYYEHSIAEGLSIARVYKRLRIVRRLSTFLGKRFEDAQKSDIVKLVAGVEQSNISQWTKQDYKVILKQFYRWLKGKDKDETPEEVKWIKLSKKIASKILKKDLLTAEEANRIVECADDVEEKALFAVLFDSGRRLGEILGLRVGDVEFDGLGAKLNVEGKVGPDIVRISGAAPRLATWLDNHPNKNDMASPLWVVGKNAIKQMSYSSFIQRLKKAVEKAGIKKRVWPYLFRHSRITPASTKLSYSQMCHVFGWKQGSDMPQFYVHLSGDDRDEAFLKMNGMECVNNGHSETSVYVPIICPRCKRNNSPDAKYCNGCGLAFDLKYAVDIDQMKDDIKEKIEMLSEELAKSPEVVDKLLNALATINGKRELNKQKEDLRN